MPHAIKAHEEIRRDYGLPPHPPRTEGGVPCTLCANHCIIGLGERGYCGLRENQSGNLKTLITPNRALLHSYLDPHITNCCAAWFCPAATGVGYPQYAHDPTWEKGYYNCSVFFYGCNFNCLFCQNSSHKNLREGTLTTLEGFIEPIKSHSHVSCICYFGGSPEPQLPFAINASKRLLEESSNRILRICFEWNGCGDTQLVRKAAELSYRSGGNIKFDLKCYNADLSLALSGVSNTVAYQNFEMIARKFYERKKPPVLTATTLLVPGYVDATEVDQIARFISDLDPEIPYSLLLFHPDFYMSDMTFTSRRQMDRCREAAKRHLKNVHVGNVQLLGLREL